MGLNMSHDDHFIKFIEQEAKHIKQKIFLDGVCNLFFKTITQEDISDPDMALVLGYYSGYSEAQSFHMADIRVREMIGDLKRRTTR